jgi:hypothetical protein
MAPMLNLHLILAILLVLGTFINQPERKMTQQSDKIYQVKAISGDITLDANWDKPIWNDIEAVELTYFMGPKPAFSPVTHAKLMYDKDHIYGIFRVQDKYVQSRVLEINGNVSGDSCVEFFFSPDTDNPLQYFNLEINAGGVPLLHYVKQPRQNYEVIAPDAIRKIEIAHSLPREVFPEITEETVWTIEFKVPLEMLRQYGPVTTPAPGVKWKANFYKTGSKTSNPNYFTWNLVENPRPNFHLPQFFGNLEFN